MHSTGAITMSKSLLLASLAALVLACGDDLPDEVDGGAQELEACLPPEVVTALEHHAIDLSATAGLLAGHPSENEVTGFLLAPALPFPPALSAAFAGPLVMPCSEPRSYAPFCEEGRCSRIECTGIGAGWRNHVALDRPVSTGRWFYESAAVVIEWQEGVDAIGFDIITEAMGPAGVDVSMIAAGRMDADELRLLATFPALHGAGATTFELVDDAAGYRGQLSIADVVVAAVDRSARLRPTGDCP
jgi:hypothetical protein